MDQLSSGASGNTLSFASSGFSIAANTITLTNNGGATDYNLALGAAAVSDNAFFTNNMVNGTTTIASISRSGNGSFMRHFQRHEHVGHDERQCRGNDSGSA